MRFSLAVQLYCALALNPVPVTVLGSTTTTTTTTVDDDPFEQGLRPSLSPGASISRSLGQAGSPRWSDYGAPRPGHVVNVATEDDVAATVRYCNRRGLRFLAQGGAHSSPTTFRIGPGDVVINLRGLNATADGDGSSSKRSLTVGAGLVLGEVAVAAAAYKRGAFAVTGACNCVGVMGLHLGGGLSFYQGEYGMSVDQIQSYRLVTAEGDLVTVDPATHPDLFWAMGGAGPNLGIVTSATLAIHPSPDLAVWTGSFTFSADKLPAFLDALNSNLTLTSRMAHVWQFAWDTTTAGGRGVIASEAEWVGAGTREDQDAARAAFAPLFDLGPETHAASVAQYEHVGDANDAFCSAGGGRKPTWHVGVDRLDVASWQAVWDEWAAFVSRTGLTASRVLVESYSNGLSREIGRRGRVAYPHRAINYHAVVQPIYEDERMDGEAERFGSRVRELWRGGSGFEPQRTYINFAHGDETLEEIYGESLPRLRQVKKTWDPQNRFNQWFPIV